MFSVSAPVVDGIALIDYAGVAITGKITSDFTKHLAYLVTDPTVTAAMTITEQAGALAGTGEYLTSFQPTVPGTWKELVVYSSGGVTRTWRPMYKVVTADQFDPAASAIVANLGYLDTTVSSRLAGADYSATTGQLSDPIDDYATPGTVGYAIRSLFERPLVVTDE